MSDNVLSSFTPTRREERPMTIPSAVGIIGTGWIAEAHAESYLNQPDVKIVALADLIPGKAEAFAKRYGLTDARCYPDHKSLLASEQLDAVSVCTYNTAHAQCTIDALAAGVNVLLEKPMSVTVQEAADIIRAEKKSGRLLSIGFQPRHGRQHAKDQGNRARRHAGQGLLSFRPAAAPPRHPQQHLY